jgi:hypothetical protein
MISRESNFMKMLHRVFGSAMMLCLMLGLMTAGVRTANADLFDIDQIINNPNGFSRFKVGADVIQLDGATVTGTYDDGTGDFSAVFDLGGGEQVVAGGNLDFSVPVGDTIGIINFEFVGGIYGGAEWDVDFDQEVFGNYGGYIANSYNAAQDMTLWGKSDEEAYNNHGEFEYLSVDLILTLDEVPPVIPEPATISLVTLGLSGLAFRRRKNRVGMTRR